MTRPFARIAVVGGGIAALTAADTLRGEGFDGELTIVGDERHAAYSRPALSKSLIAPGADVQSAALPTVDVGAKERRGVAATALDVDARRVRLSDGDELAYDGLVIATGSRAIRLGSCDDVVTLRGIDDAITLQHRLQAARDVVVVGGGVLGMEVASGAAASGCRVTVVSRGTPMRRMLGDHLAERIASVTHATGVSIEIAGGAEVIELDGRSAVRTSDGRMFRGDLTVSAVGDVPNTEWLAGSGLARSGPLPVDVRGRMRHDVVAAGDVAAPPSASGHRRVPLWHAAIDQARAAATALLHGDSAPPYAPRPYFWTEQFGLELRIAGDLPVAGEPDVIDAAGDGSLLLWAAGGSGTAAAINYRLPVPRLRRLAQGGASSTAVRQPAV